MAQKTWLVYGLDGHRQKESFAPSMDFTTWTGERVKVFNADKTGNHDYCIIMITAETERECEQALDAQISDGIFEDCRTGEIVEAIEIGSYVYIDDSPRRADYSLTHYRAGDVDFLHTEGADNSIYAGENIKVISEYDGEYN